MSTCKLQCDSKSCTSEMFLIEMFSAGLGKSHSRKDIHVHTCREIHVGEQGIADLVKYRYTNSHCYQHKKDKITVLL